MTCPPTHTAPPTCAGVGGGVLARGACQALIHRATPSAWGGRSGLERGDEFELRLLRGLRGRGRVAGGGTLSPISA